MNLDASPANLTLSRGQSANVQVTVSASSGSIDKAVALACSGLPIGVSCVFAQPSVTPGKSSASTTLTVSASQQVASAHRMGPLYAMLMPGFGFAGLFVIGERKRLKRGMLLVSCLVLLLIACSCGGGSMSAMKDSPVQSPSPSGTSNTYMLSVNGVSGQLQSSATITLQIK